MEIVLLEPPRLDRVATEKARDISADPLVDPREQVRRRRIERVVEIEDPGVDMGKISAHCRARLGGGAKAGTAGSGKRGDRKSTRLTPVTNAHLVCRLLLDKNKDNHIPDEQTRAHIRTR